MSISIYHNPRCMKSRQALTLLQEKGHKVEIIEYLKDALSVEDLKLLLAKLDMKPHDIIRKGEVVYKEKFKGKSFSDEEWIDIIIEHPKLIERPIVVKGNKAVVGRPIENVERLIG